MRGSSFLYNLATALGLTDAAFSAIMLLSLSVLLTALVYSSACT